MSHILCNIVRSRLEERVICLHVHLGGVGSVIVERGSLRGALLQSVAALSKHGRELSQDLTETVTEAMLKG